MKKLILILFLLSISFSSFGSALYPEEYENSFRQMPRFASGTETPPIASAAEGDIFINFATPSATLLQIRVANAWRSIGGGGGTAPVGDYQPIASMSVYQLIASMSAYQTVAGMGSYQPVASMSAYQTVAGMSAYQPVASMGSYALSSSLSSYQPVASMSAYALSSSVPNNASFTLANLSERNFSSLQNTPTTMEGYGITDGSGETATFTGNKTITGTLSVGAAPVSIATGSSSNLALRFSSDTDTGITSLVGNTISVFGGGGRVAIFGNNDDVAHGYQALNNLAAGSNRSNVGIGYSAGSSLNTSSLANVFVGSNAGNNGSQAAAAQNSIGIGNGTYTTASNQAVIGNTNVNDVRLASGKIAQFTTTVASFPGALDLGAIATPTAAAGRMFRGTDNNFYYCSDGSNWTKLN
jgi:hypothetical protein